MSAGKHTATDSAHWYVHADRAGHYGHGLHAGLDERRANSLALIITTSLLFVLFASALMVGGRVIISPLLREPAIGTLNDRGDIVYTMPDGTFCQHMTFDNTTGRITPGAIDRCNSALAGGGADTSTGFRWGSH